MKRILPIALIIIVWIAAIAYPYPKYGGSGSGVSAPTCTGVVVNNNGTLSCLTPTTLVSFPSQSAGTNGKALLSTGVSGSEAWGVSSSCTPTIIDGHAGITITAAAMSSCNNAMLVNTGQVQSNVTNTLPPCSATVPMQLMVQISTSVTNSNSMLASPNVDIKSNGSTTAYQNVGFTSPLVGNYYSVTSVPTGTNTCMYEVTLGTGTTFTTF
jgi:hypothetical protein